MATHAASTRDISGLARAMAQHGLMTEYEAETLQTQAAQAGATFVDHVLAGKRISANQLAVFASRAFGVPLFDLLGFDVNQLQNDLIDLKIAQARQVLPLHKRGNRLYVATSDPANLQGLEEIRFKTNLVVEPVVVENDKLAAIIHKLVEASGALLKDVGSMEDLEIDLQESDNPQASDEESSEVEDAPVVRYLQKILLDAIAAGVSDIHFEPYEKFYRVRYRLDGILMEVAQPPLVIKDKLASRIKVISKLDISEKRVPQDGRMKIVMSKSKAIDFRVSTLPTLFGEKIVMRILDSSGIKLGIEALGYEPDQKAALMEAIGRPYGMILVTGPTGSGKTVSLYTGLNILNTEDNNISTAEDPVEIMLAGINQVNINPKVGLTFAGALRAFLRQDPDIIMVGEIRDLETAEIALKAAQTGHLVLSTLHTNDAPKTLTRLVDMGVKPYAIATSVSLIIAQRLARRLCKNCRAPMKIPDEALLKEGFTREEIANGIEIFSPVGCTQCTDGYKGRTGIYEVMPVSEQIGRIIMGDGNVLDIKEQAAREGVWGLRKAGLNKVRQGITSLDELNQVTVD
jgi:type IV pilus assembly protein PilB